MPALTRSRLEEIKLLVGAFNAAMARGKATDIVDLVPKLVTAVDEVNASLAEVDEWVGDGLRDEAVTMHDPELVTVARLLDVRGHTGWLSLHGWLLERGHSPPAAVNLDAAELLVSATEPSADITEDLGQLRRLVLERQPVHRQLEVLRRLRAIDPASQVWADAVTTHEDARLRELRTCIPEALEQGDIATLAAMSQELADATWVRRPPAELVSLTAGATEAREVMLASREAVEIASEISKCPGLSKAIADRDVDRLSSLRQRLDELVSHVETIKEALSARPAMLRLVASQEIDVAMQKSVERVAAELERIDRMAALLRTRRDFASACQRIDYLCDHPPESGDEGKWLADLQRCDMTARSACQEIPDLGMPALMRERIQRAIGAVEARDRLKRRFWLVVTGASAAALLVVTAAIGWFMWTRSEYSRTIAELERRVSESRFGVHLERPSGIDRIAGAYADDARVAALLDDFDSGVAAEKGRCRTFKEKLATHGERIEELAADVDERRTAGEDRWLEPWPSSFVDAVNALNAARRSGGLPDRREKSGTAIATPVAAQRRFQDEEDRLAEAEARQSELDRSLKTLALKAFDSRLSELREKATRTTAADARSLLVALKSLREQAKAPKAEQLSVESGGQRIAYEAVDALNAIEKRLQTILREPEVEKETNP